MLLVLTPRVIVVTVQDALVATITNQPAEVNAEVFLVTLIMVVTDPSITMEDEDHHNVVAVPVAEEKCKPLTFQNISTLTQ